MNGLDTRTRTHSSHRQIRHHALHSSSDEQTHTQRQPPANQRPSRPVVSVASLPAVMTSLLARAMGMRSASSEEDEDEMEQQTQTRATNESAAPSPSSASAPSRPSAPVAAPLLRTNSNGAIGQPNGGQRPAQQQFATNGQTRPMQPSQQQQRRESTTAAGRTGVHSNGDEDSGRKWM